MTVRRPLLPVLALLTAFITALAAGSLPAGAAPAVSVLSGATPQTSVFPSNRFTVPDADQLTGRRIKLPMPVCGEDTYSACDDVTLLNQLDGFDIQPRVTIPFSGPIQLDSVNSSTVYVEGPGYRAGLTQIVWDPETDVLAGTPKDQLTEGTTYTIVIDGVLDEDGHEVGVPAVSRRTSFTTLSATTELDRIRQSLDSGLAYTQAGIVDGAKTAKVDATFTAATGTGIQRRNQVEADPDKPLQSEIVPTTQVPVGTTIGFGSFESPQFVDGEGVIDQVPTSQTPPARNKARIGFTLIVPNSSPPAGGFPVAVYGPGFTRSKYDLFLTADFNAAAGVATLATDPLGHAYGPKSEVVITEGTAKTTVSAYGRGKDLDLDGKISASEGAGPTFTTTKQPDGSFKPTTPSRRAIVGLRDGLIQTVVDNMALVRTIEAGIDVDGDDKSDISANPATSPVMYYGLSFGGIYGTMLMGTDTHVRTGLLNVGGGPIVDIARLSGFRNLLAKQLSANKPNLLNGGPGLQGFTESIPLPLDPRITKPVAGAVALQEYFARGNWLERRGSPESYAPLIRLRPRAGAPKKTVLIQQAFGDQTVPNFTGGNVVRAGRLEDRVTYYRNDRTVTAFRNPHGFLEDPSVFGREMAEFQLGEFLRTRGGVVDPDTPAGPIFEVPIANANNLNCLHYPDPQTGQRPSSLGSSGECPAAPAEPKGRPAGPAGDGGGSGGGGSGGGGSGGGGSGGGGSGGGGSGGGGNGGGGSGSGSGGGSGSGSGGGSGSGSGGGSGSGSGGGSGSDSGSARAGGSSGRLATTGGLPSFAALALLVAVAAAARRRRAAGS